MKKVSRNKYLLAGKYLLIALTASVILAGITAVSNPLTAHAITASECDEQKGEKHIGLCLLPNGTWRPITGP